jgi:hypothetical protein
MVFFLPELRAAAALEKRRGFLTSVATIQSAFAGSPIRKLHLRMNQQIHR